MSTVWLDATAQAELVRTGRAAPHELVQDAVDALRRVDPQVSAVVRERYDAALEQARGPLPGGPLRGVPVLLKDLGWHEAGEVTGEGTTWLEGVPRPADSGVALALRRAGTVVLGRTLVPELATTVTTEPAALGRLGRGPTRNPYDLGRTAGGSSGGSAAAVATGAVAVATASDGGGSIRIPASACGLVGLKPSRGRISAGPQAGESWAGATTDGVLTRTVRDTAALLDVLAGPLPGDPYSAPPPARPYAQELGREPGRLRVGLLAALPDGDAPADPDAAAAVAAAGALLAGLGHAVEDAFPAALADPGLGRHVTRIIGADVALALAEHERLVGRQIADDELEPRNRAYRGIGTAPAVRYLESRAWLGQFARRAAAWWAQGYDVLVTPSVNGPAPLLGALDDAGAVRRWVPWSAAANVTGQPAVSLPLHTTAAGLPVGVQLVAAYAREDLLLRLSAQLERSAPWADRRPAVAA